MHDQDLAILKGLVAVAWADGRVAAEEQQVIDALLEAFEAAPSEAGEVRLFAQERKTLDDIPLTDLSYDDRRVLLQHAVVITHIDGEQVEAERELLVDLAQRLSIPAAEAHHMLAVAEQRASSLRELL